jgi:hypothetical protein
MGKNKHQSNKKGFMEGMNMLVSIIIIALAFTIFSAYALYFGIPKTKFNVDNVNIMQDAVFIENYLNTPITDDKKISFTTMYDELMAYYQGGSDHKIRSKTDEIMGMIGRNPNYLIQIGEGKTQRSIQTSGFKSKELIMDETTMLPNQKGNALKLRMRIST